jgi:8-oxo-dGTP pyrophosphatase MutT (NUDIX family)
MRLGYRVAYVVLRASALVTHPRTRGVKCVLVDGDGRALFVRHTYGDRAQWELPGGGARRDEPLAGAASREAWEELGVDVASWAHAGTIEGEWYAKVEELAVFRAPFPGGPVRRDAVEIAAAEWFPLDAPPAPLGPTTAAALRALGCPPAYE